MDLIDKEILRELDADCRISYKELSEKIGISPNSIRRRIDRMRTTGTILRFFIKPQLEMMDADLLLGIINTDGKENANEFITWLGSLSRVLEVNRIASGNGGLYCIFVQYSGSHDLADIGYNVRRHPNILDIELHTLVVGRGKRMKLSSNQLKVIKVLLEDPRMSMVDIRKKTNMSTKKIKRILEQLQDGGGLHFGVRCDLSADDDIEILLRIDYNDKLITYNGILETLKSKYPLNFWCPFISATDSTIFVAFVVNNLQQAKEIAEEIEKLEEVSSSTTYIYFSSTQFPFPGEIYLNEMIQENTIF